MRRFNITRHIADLVLILNFEILSRPADQLINKLVVAAILLLFFIEVEIRDEFASFKHWKFVLLATVELGCLLLARLRRRLLKVVDNVLSLNQLVNVDWPVWSLDFV